jgi:hypothetical protein
LVSHLSNSIRVLISSLIVSSFTLTAPSIPLSITSELSLSFQFFSSICPILSFQLNSLFSGVLTLFDKLIQYDSHFLLCHLPKAIPEVFESLSQSYVPSTSVFHANIMNFCKID